MVRVFVNQCMSDVVCDRRVTTHSFSDVNFSLSIHLFKDHIAVLTQSSSLLVVFHIGHKNVQLLMWPSDG